MSVKGLDTIDHTLTGKMIAAAGYAFVCRYYAGGASNIGKEITRAEVPEKTAAGVRIVSNWEVQAVPKNTVAEGKAHANAFLQQHKDVGGPDWAPCYYSVDTAAKANAYDAYAHGWADVLSPERLGVYGDGALYRQLKKDGLITLAWQSMSSSFPGNKDTTGADAIQTGSGHVSGHSVDFNIAVSDYYGGWLQGEEDPMSGLTAADITLLLGTKLPGDASTGGGISIGDALRLAALRAGTAANVEEPAIAAQLTALAAKVAAIPTTAAPAAPVDTAALAAAITPAVVAGVKALLSAEAAAAASAVK